MTEVNPANLAAASVFNSFKNYGSYTGTVTVSGGVSPTPPSNFATFSTSFDLERQDIITQVYMQTTGDANKTFSLVGGYAPLRDGTTPTLGTVPYNLAFTFTYSGTTITCQAAVVNPYFETLTLTTETITFIVKTFITPFSD